LLHRNLKRRAGRPGNHQRAGSGFFASSVVGRVDHGRGEKHGLPVDTSRRSPAGDRG
jgi:hypothetical protein